MKVSIKGVLGFVGLATLIGSFPVSAAPKRKSKTRVQLETYPAIEDVEISADATPRQIRISRTEMFATVEPLENEARTRGIEERVHLLEKRQHERNAVAGAAPSARTPGATAAAFEKVPEDKTDMIASRLKLVEMILRESGRAYDYRTLTSHQLRQLLDSVRASNARRAKGVSATRAAE